MPARRPAASHSIQNSPDRVPPFARCALCPLPPKSADDCPSDKPREPLFCAVPSCPPYADSRNTTRVFAAHFDRSSISHYPARARHHSRCLSPYQRAPILVKYNEMFLVFIDNESGTRRDYQLAMFWVATFHCSTTPILQPRAQAVKMPNGSDTAVIDNGKPNTIGMTRSVR